MRGVPIDRVRALVTAQTETSLLGDAHVNVLALNRALDAVMDRLKERFGSGIVGRGSRAARKRGERR